jgi:hypothetical protein
VQRNLQLALYQYAVDHGAVEGHVAGGAELVQLGILDGGPEAVVQVQDRHRDGDAPREALRASLALAAGRVRAEEFPAVAGDHCRGCAFLSLCPAKGAGSVVA